MNVLSSSLYPVVHFTPPYPKVCMQANPSIIEETTPIPAYAATVSKSQAQNFLSILLLPVITVENYLKFLGEIKKGGRMQKPEFLEV